MKATRFLACAVLVAVLLLTACGEAPVTSTSPKPSSEPAAEQAAAPSQAEGGERETKEQPAPAQESARDSEPNPVPETKPAPQPKTAVAYDIYSVTEDLNISYGTKYGGQTYLVELIIKEPANADQLRLTCQAAAQEVQKTRKKKVDAIIIRLYDYPEYVGYGYTLGQAVLTSDGSWQWDLKDKDWSRRLTSEEVKIWAAWQQLYHQKAAASPGTLVDEDAVTKEIAARFKTTATQVETILRKQLAWSM